MSKPLGIAALLFVHFGMGCIAPAYVTPSASIAELCDTGDTQRQASLRLVLTGLRSDAAQRGALAISQYERALRVDSYNPFAYLALARRLVESGDGPRALSVLDQAKLFFESFEIDSPGVRAHLLGLRGAALQLTGRASEGKPLLEMARKLAPAEWDDAHLSADELQ